MTQFPTNNSEQYADSEAIRAASRLMFSHYSQLDPKWGFEVGTERKMCGLVCIKSVTDYYSEKIGFPSLDMETILQFVKDAHDTKANGMSHAVEVKLLKSRGLVAWRRNWSAPSSDIQWLVDNEQYSAEQIAAIDAQQTNELIATTQRER